MRRSRSGYPEVLARDVACDVCGAKKGQRCANGVGEPRDNAHHSRVGAGLRASLVEQYGEDAINDAEAHS